MQLTTGSDAGLAGTIGTGSRLTRTTMSPTEVVPRGTTGVGCERPVAGLPSSTVAATTTTVFCTVGTFGNTKVPLPAEVVDSAPTVSVTPLSGWPVSLTVRPATVVS